MNYTKLYMDKNRELHFEAMSKLLDSLIVCQMPENVLVHKISNIIEILGESIAQIYFVNAWSNKPATLFVQAKIRANLEKYKIVRLYILKLRENLLLKSDIDNRDRYMFYYLSGIGDFKSLHINMRMVIAGIPNMIHYRVNCCRLILFLTDYTLHPESDEDNKLCNMVQTELTLNMSFN